MSGNKTKVLLVGDANNIFLFNYAKWLRVEKTDLIVDVLSTSGVNDDKLPFYNQIIDLSKLKGFAFIDKMKGLRRVFLIFLYLRILSQLKDYDFVHFHFISPLRYSLISIIRHFTKSKVILSVWGSDMYRLNLFDKFGFKSACRKADLISFGNPDSIRFFIQNYKWKKQNLMHCRFGLAPLDSLADLSKTKEQCKSELGWDHNKLSIALGYNLSIGQQHLKIIEQFKSPELLSLCDKIELILPISYGGNQSYKDHLLKELNSLPYKFFVYDQYLYDMEIARLRMACDVMIQVQTTDQFSGSMQEHIYADNVVITGAWLPYGSMKEKGIYFEELNDISELKKLLPHIIENYPEYSSKTVNNKTQIANMSLWRNTIQAWTKLYN